MKKLLFIIFLFIFIQKDFVLASNEVASQSSLNKKETVSYDLPYPGILADNPLYFFKTARDKFVSFLINDPLKKAEFNLLTSDKRLNGGYYLAKKEKKDLAIVSISKSNNYFFESISLLSQAKELGKSTDSLANRMSLSLKKHEEVLKSLEKSFGPKYKNQLVFEYKRLAGFEKSVNVLLSK
ncbi:MAG: hypothetical protein A2857_02665 [Candidatus Levybacteria bacterium RIFCSPHIGHO2_01_FULL_36_15]|nr:MAG: hypothetical protein A2857_02665 [Candidatus Levybacteria bacterium RIFCSPHIGHO2_01_FULL_36_15]